MLTMVENTPYYIAAQANRHPKPPSAWVATWKQELDTMMNMMTSPFFKSAPIKLLKRAIIGLLKLATFAESS
jgi:hypothetical protein